MDDVDYDIVTKCWQCDRELSDAKCLPCSHTFCRGCLEALCGKTIPGAHQPCPQCRNSFRIPTNGCGGLPDNLFVAALQRLRREVTSSRETVRRLEELNRTLEEHNIEAGSKCVENMIRATEKVSKLERRLSTVEKDRDTARQRLCELEQSAPVSGPTDSRRCEHCQQLDSSDAAPTVSGSPAELKAQSVEKCCVGESRPAAHGCDELNGNNKSTARATSNKTALAMVLVVLSGIVIATMVTQHNLVDPKEELATASSECWMRLKEMTEQLSRERLVHEDELARIRQKYGEQSETETVTGDEQRLNAGDDDIWTTVMAYVCRSSFLNSLLYHWCRPQVVAPDDV